MTDRTGTLTAGEASELLTAVLDHSEDVVVVIDRAGLVRQWSRSAERTYGYGAADMLGEPFVRCVPAESLPAHTRGLAAVDSDSARPPLKIVHVTKLGVSLHMSVNFVRLGGEGGLIAMLARNVSDERRTARAMRASEARWRSIIESAVDAIIVCDRRGRIESINAAAERLFGYRADEVLGQNVSILMPPPYSIEHDGYIERYLRTRERRIIGIGREVTAKRRDGSTFPIHLSVGEAVIDGESKFTGIVRDLTDRVALETKLRQESGLARVGELAAVLAHEVKNPLAAVSGAVQMLATYLPPGGEEQQVVREVLQRVDALSKLMSDMLLYARPPQPVPQPIEIMDLLNGAVAFFKSDPQSEHLRIQVDARPGSVFADPQLMHIALQNLLINASHAIRGQGEITIRTVDEPRLLHIDVIDHGPGILPEVRDRVFTPFFTTKTRGTGLGLPTVRRIAESHRGGVEILRTGSDGTTMRLTLPLGN